MPNISGSGFNGGDSNKTYTTTGCFNSLGVYVSGTIILGAAYSNKGYVNSISATNNSDIYGNSDSVQPKTMRVYKVVRI